MNIYLGTFLIAAAALALEVTLTRLLSVTSWYYLAFFAISCAMLGMTAGATTVYLKPHWFARDRLKDSIAIACLGYGLLTPVALIILCLTPLDLDRSLMSVLALLTTTAACSLPFYFSGIALSAVITKSELPIGRLYASDMIGGSLGCLLVLAGLEFLDAPSLVLLCASIGGLAALSFTHRSPSSRLRRLSRWTFVILIVSVFLNAPTPYGIRPVVVKGIVEDAGAFVVERWNSFSRVVVFRGRVREPQYWGASPMAPKDLKIFQHHMNIDGLAGTTLRPFSSLDDIDHLRYDVANVAYYLRPNGGACIIGVGAGRDAQSAILFGHESIVAIDVNPIFIDLLKNEFREFAGIADHEGVTLVVDEARSYLSRTEANYSIIQMSLIDTWAGTGAGAFSLSENSLYTEEAWQVFLNRLADDGIFTVSRWYSQGNLGETGRMVSLAVASLLHFGTKDPSQHIAMVTADRVSTLLVSKQPFTSQDIAELREVSRDLQYDLVIVPGIPPNHETLRKILAASSSKLLEEAIAEEPLNYEPPTDENPYFFNMLRLGHIRASLLADPGVVAGNLLATLTLVGLILSLFLMAMATIVFPLALRARTEGLPKTVRRTLWPGAVYFSLIGAGFMFLEIALIQRLSVFLSHPTYALGILLFTIIASTGIGSLLSERLPLTKFPWVFVYPVTIALAIIAIRFALPVLLSTMITSGMPSKIVISILVIAPLGIFMGFFFPTGMRLARSSSGAETPWYWALNGIFGVLSAALAVFCSIYFGISTSFYIAAICYTSVLVPLYFMYNASLIHATDVVTP